MDPKVLSHTQQVALAEKEISEAKATLELCLEKRELLRTNFKTMVCARAGGAPAQRTKDSEDIMRYHHLHGDHLVVVGDTRDTIDKNRINECTVFGPAPGDNIHMYRGGGYDAARRGEWPYYHGICESGYEQVSETYKDYIPTSIRNILERDADVSSRPPGWWDNIVIYRCKIAWEEHKSCKDLDPDVLKSLMKGGHGTVIHLKNMP